ncbi:unnamed protein product [Nezara viridula]|uniref:Uncharacterized protein n=1 Tax=Nezara viridula TaxID=85310 RepID=A0A9P0MTD4_NEZVI|nr:unnamed protein product [Nezara viridula]
MTSFHSSNDFLGFFIAGCVHKIILAITFFFICRNFLHWYDGHGALCIYPL